MALLEAILAAFNNLSSLLDKLIPMFSSSTAQKDEDVDAKVEAEKEAVKHGQLPAGD